MKWSVLSIIFKIYEHTLIYFDTEFAQHIFSVIIYCHNIRLHNFASVFVELNYCLGNVSGHLEIELFRISNSITVEFVYYHILYT